MQQYMQGHKNTRRKPRENSSGQSSSGQWFMTKTSTAQETKTKLDKLVLN